MGAKEEKRDQSAQPRQTREPIPPAEGQEESLKVHGDKLERLIPRDGEPKK
jgi:hypothetical protein